MDQQDLMFEGDEVTRWMAAYDDGSYPDNFWGWLRDNKHIFLSFVDIAKRAKSRGYSQWSARAVLHILRWETSIKEAGQELLKINNNATPGLARLAMRIHPDLDGFFETRRAPNTSHGRRLIDGKLYSEPETEE